MAIILITGSSTGIGFTTAEFLAQGGHKVYATMRNPKDSPQLQTLADKKNLLITILPLDVDNDESVKACIDDIMSREGNIDVLINNAGIENLRSVEETSLEEYKRIMETNFFGSIRCVKAVLPSMRQRKKGYIINISSVAGKIYSNFHSSYCSSKAALEAFSEALAQEVTHFNIKVVLVEPGVIETPILHKRKPVPQNTSYPDIKRIKAFFSASIENHVSPVVVAEVIQEIIQNNSPQFRYTAGPDALPLLNWRNSLSDEEWVDSVKVDQQTWAKGMKEGLNLDVLPYV
jgi:NAD(P)-dependent dehydrogenase (short-subunit alcohol dehydrogenase family)